MTELWKCDALQMNFHEDICDTYWDNIDILARLSQIVI